MAYKNKTQPSQQSVEDFINSLPSEQTKKDCFELIEMMRSATGREPQFWVGGLIGFGNYRYKSAAGTGGDWFVIGFAPRKQNITLYLMGGMQSNLLQKIGKHKSGVGCLYINKLADIDKSVLQELLIVSVKTNKQFIKT
jgi:hypothetical protein